MMINLLNQNLIVKKKLVKIINILSQEQKNVKHRKKKKKQIGKEMQMTNDQLLEEEKEL